jgi:hypothetical protein
MASAAFVVLVFVGGFDNQGHKEGMQLECQSSEQTRGRFSRMQRIEK